MDAAFGRIVMTRIAIAALALLAVACSPQPAETAATETPAPETPAPQPETPTMNTLTAEEQAQGWKLLFNGTDLTGWKNYKKDGVGPQWKVENGELALTAGGGGDIMTVEQYGPFELSLEWKISPNGNSGIIYLVKEDDKAPNTYNTGPEMQVLDDDGHPDGKIPSHRAGALYDFVVPPPGTTKPVGEWNLAVVKFTGNRIEHWQNGTLVSETSYGDDAWKAKVAATKFKTMPLFGLASSGHIALQDHGDKVWYRNIKVKPL
jgi:hypothetical protein